MQEWRDILPVRCLLFFVFIAVVHGPLPTSFGHLSRHERVMTVTNHLKRLAVFRPHTNIATATTVREYWHHEPKTLHHHECFASLDASPFQGRQQLHYEHYPNVGVNPYPTLSIDSSVITNPTTQKSHPEPPTHLQTEMDSYTTTTTISNTTPNHPNPTTKCTKHDILHSKKSKGIQPPIFLFVHERGDQEGRLSSHESQCTKTQKSKSWC